MHYVKHFDINGVATKQVACIELHGKPNGATEGFIGLLGIDMDSPTHDVYKCVEVRGSIYTWELLSSGMSILSAVVSGKGESNVTFSYADLQMPDMYLVKIGDLIFDAQGYLYRVVSIGATSCDAAYTGTQIVGYGEDGKDGVSVVDITIAEVGIYGWTLKLENTPRYSSNCTLTLKFADGSSVLLDLLVDATYEGVVSVSITDTWGEYTMIYGTGDIGYSTMLPYETLTIPLTQDSTITMISK